MIVPVGAAISTTIAVVALELSLPIASRALTEIELLPDERLVSVDDHVVLVGYDNDPIVAVEQVTTIVEASVAFVPVTVWVWLFVGVVTAFITGTDGGVVSSVIVSEYAPDQLPRLSEYLT